MTYTEVRVGVRSRNAAAGGAAHEADAHEVGLDHRLDRVGFLADGHGERVESDGTAMEPAHERLQDGAIKSVKANRVNVVQVEGGVYGCRRGAATVDDDVVADPP